MRARKQSSTNYPITFRLVSDSESRTGATGLTPTVAISKNGGAFAAAAGAVSEVGNGLYALAGNATDRNTLGTLRLYVAAVDGSNDEMLSEAYEIVASDPHDGVPDVAASVLDHVMRTIVETPQTPVNIKFSRSATRVPASSYVAPADGGTAWNGPSSAGTREFFTNGQPYRVRQTGIVESISIYLNVITGLTGLYIKVWRKVGTKYVLIHRTENLQPQAAGAQVNTLYCIPFAVREGDYIGYVITTNTGSATVFKAFSGQTGTSTRFQDTEYTGTGVVDIDALNNGSGYAVPIRLNMQAPVLVVDGDSIGAGANQGGAFTTYSAGYSYLLDNNIASIIGKSLGVPYQNMSRGSMTTAQIYSALATDVVALCPTIVVINGGINDVAAITEDSPGVLNVADTAAKKATFTSNWTSILDDLTAKKIIPVVILMGPWGTADGTTRGYNQRMVARDDWNAALVTLCGSYADAIVVDPNEVLSKNRVGGADGNLWDPKTNMCDGTDLLHPTTLGYQVLGQHILNAISNGVIPAGTLTGAERNAVADAMLDRSNAIETGVTMRNLHRLMLAVLSGNATVTDNLDGTYTSVFKRKDGSTSALTITDDGTGTRTGSTIGTL